LKGFHVLNIKHKFAEIMEKMHKNKKTAPFFKKNAVEKLK
jgi:hypothetical protein